MGGKRSGYVARGVRIRTYPSGLQALQIQFQYRGVQCRETLSAINPALKSSQRYAINLKAEIEARIERGAFDYATFFPDSQRARQFGHAASALTVSEAQESLIQDLDAAGREPTTINAYRRSAKRINAYLGPVRVSDLAPEDIRSMVRQRQVSRKTWNNDLIPLRRALKRAMHDRIVHYSPLDRVDLGELVPRSQRPRPDPFTLAEINAILGEAIKYCRKSRNLYQFLFYTGMRLEEATALEWPDVDLPRAYVSKAAQLSLKSAETKPPKTAAGERVVDLLPRAQDALLDQRQFTFFRGEHVFCRWNSMRPFSSYDQLRLRWITILKRAGVRHRPLRQTRHTYASHMLSSGEREIYVANQLGHAGTSLLDVYATWVDGWRDEHREMKYGT